MRNLSKKWSKFHAIWVMRARVSTAEVSTAIVLIAIIVMAVASRIER